MNKFTMILVILITYFQVNAENYPIDKTGWEKVMINPNTGKPIPTFNDFYVGYGIISVFGDNARILALYAEDADHLDTDSERRGSKLISARDVYTSMRKGPAVAASLLGKGRVIVHGMPDWFNRMPNFYNRPVKTAKQKAKQKKKEIKDKKNKGPQNEDFHGMDLIFLENSLKWLAKGKDLNTLKIVTLNKTVSSALKLGNVKLINNHNL